MDRSLFKIKFIHEFNVYKIRVIKNHMFYDAANFSDLWFKNHSYEKHVFVREKLRFSAPKTIFRMLQKLCEFLRDFITSKL